MGRGGKGRFLCICVNVFALPQALDELKQSDPVAEIRARRTQRVLDAWHDKTGADYENVRKLPSIIENGTRIAMLLRCYCALLCRGY